MANRRVFLLLLVVAFPASTRAEVWQRTRSDGTVEFTNMPRTGQTWRHVKGLGHGTETPRAAMAAPPARPAATGLRDSVIWSRENADGTVEFTNLPPVGARWKVLYRIGPGKASALRGVSDIVPPRDTSSARFERFDQHVHDQQAFYGIPPTFLKAVIKTESDFDPHVVSSAGAVGLMQLMPGTARSMGVTDIWDARQNIMGGARYLQTLVRRFCRTQVGRDTGAGFVCSRDETVKVIAGYHAGPGAVEKYGGMPPYETTRAYVTTVLGRFDQYRLRETQTAAVAKLP